MTKAVTDKCWKTDRQHCFKSGNNPQTRVAKFTSMLWQSYAIQKNPTDTERGFVGAEIFYKEHAQPLPQPQF